MAGSELGQVRTTGLRRLSSCAAHSAHRYPLDERRGKAIPKVGWCILRSFSYNYHFLYEPRSLGVGLPGRLLLWWLPFGDRMSAHVKRLSTGFESHFSHLYDAFGLLLCHKGSPAELPQVE